jgi:hypothetical protein
MAKYSIHFFTKNKLGRESFYQYMKGLRLHRIKLNDCRLPGEKPTKRFEVEGSFRDWGELLPHLTNNCGTAELLVEKAERPTHNVGRYFPGHLQSAISGDATPSRRGARPVQPWILKLKSLLSPKQPTPIAYEFVKYRFEWPYSWLPKDEWRKFWQCCSLCV